jgi:hypothetical protein
MAIPDRVRDCIREAKSLSGYRSREVAWCNIKLEIGLELQSLLEQRGPDGVVVLLNGKEHIVQSVESGPDSALLVAYRDSNPVPDVR